MLTIKRITVSYTHLYQQRQHIIQAERETFYTYTLHDVEYEFGHFYFQPVAVAADDTLQGCGMQ